jgi:hypothetical protein
MEWKADALKELEKVPENVRNMAKMGIETAVEKKGKNIVTLDDVNEAAAQFRAIMGKEEKEEKTTKIAVDAPEGGFSGSSIAS